MALLQQVQVGQNVTVKNVCGTREEKMKLVHMGILPGSPVCVLNRNASSVLIRVKHSRVMLDLMTAERIQIV